MVNIVKMLLAGLTFKDMNYIINNKNRFQEDNMGHFRKLKKNILILFLLLSTIPLGIVGGALLYMGITKSNIFMNAIGSLVVFIAIFTTITVIMVLKTKFSAIVKAFENLIDTLSPSEKEVLELSAGKSPIRYIHSLLDYLAGKRILAENGENQRKFFEATALCTDEIIWRRDEESESFIVPEIWKQRYPHIAFEENSVITDYVHSEDLSALNSALEVMLVKSGRRAVVNFRFLTGEDTYISARLEARSVENRGKIFAVGAISDITKTIELESTIREKYLMYHFALNAVPDIIYEVDVETDAFTILNPERWNELFDLPLNGGFTLHRASYAALIHPDNIQGFRDRFGNYDHLVFMPDKRVSFDYRIKRKNNDWTWVRHSVTCVKEEDGHALKVVGLISDINEKKKQEFRDIYGSKHDSLTGCLLRSSLEAEFSDLTNVLGKEDIAFVIVDIDNFKKINDFYGYRAGDIVLRKTASVIWSSQLGTCIVGRIDSDDFLIIMSTVSEWQRPEMVARKAANLFEEPVSADGHSIQLSVSIGCSEYKKDGKTFAELLEKAYAAQKAARKLGRNKYLMYKDIENVGKE